MTSRMGLPLDISTLHVCIINTGHYMKSFCQNIERYTTMYYEQNQESTFKSYQHWKIEQKISEFGQFRIVTASGDLINLGYMI